MEYVVLTLRFQWRTAFIAWDLKASAVKYAIHLWKHVASGLPKIATPKIVWIVECTSGGLQTCSWYLALSRHRMAKSSKRSRSKCNSLLPAKQFDNTTVDDDLEELQCGVSEENIIWHHFYGWAAAMVSCAGPVFEELYAFLHVCIHFFRGKTTLQLPKVLIYHGEIKPLSGWQAVAFGMRMLGGRVSHSTSTNSMNLFSLGQHKERTQVLNVKKGIWLCSKVIIWC